MSRSILRMALSGVLLGSLFAACMPARYLQVTTPTNREAVVSAQQHTLLSGNEAALEQISKGLVIAMQIEPPAIAPARHMSPAGGFMNELTHNGLFRMNYSDLEPLPDLIIDWEAISDTLFEFRLREGVMFHNGEEMTAEDVVASIFYLRTYFEARAYHGSVVGAEVVDRYTFRLDTGVPNAMLFSDLTNQANFILPKSLIEAGHDFTAQPIGSGPFVFDGWRAGESLHFVRFDDYFDDERSANLKYVHWRIIPEGPARAAALEAGEVDYIVEVDFSDVARLRANPNTEVVMIPGTMFNFMRMDNEIPHFENVYVRRAIDMAIDKEAVLIAGMDGFGIPVRENVPTVFAGSSSEGVRGFDPEGAMALLAEHRINPADISFTMLVTGEADRRRGEIIQANLADIGIVMVIETVESATFLNAAKSGYYEAFFDSFMASSLIQFLRHISHINGNRNHMCDELYALIDQAVATIDTEARLAILEEASRAANEHAGVIPMHLGKVIRAFNSNLVVPELSATGAMHLNMVRWAE